MTISPSSFPTPKPSYFSEKKLVASSESAALNHMLYQHDLRQVSLVTPDYPAKETIYSSSPASEDALAKEASLAATRHAINVSTAAMYSREQATLAPRPGKSDQLFSFLSIAIVVDASYHSHCSCSKIGIQRLRSSSFYPLDFETKQIKRLLWRK